MEKQQVLKLDRFWHLFFLSENKKLQVTMKFFTKIGRKKRKPYTLGYTQ